MKGIQVLLFALVSGVAVAENPLGQVIALLNDLSAKITAEGAAAEKAAAEYAEWCKDKITDTGFAIQTGSASKDELEATIAKMSAELDASGSKITDLAGSIAESDKELAEATAEREKEVAVFKTSEAELMDAIETLGRASVVLEREMAKKPAALAQIDTSNAQNMIRSLSAIINAAGLAAGDQKKLMALVQSQQNSDADDDEMDAPAAAVYKTHSTNILDVIEDLKEKAEGELSDLRKAETQAKHNFDMLKQSLTDSMEADKKNMADTKSSKASYAETKASAEGDLAETIKSLEADIKTKGETEITCKEVAEDHAASMKGRSEELATIAKAKAVLEETSAGAVKQTYAASSFFQLSKRSAGGALLRDHSRLANVEIVSLLKRLAKQHHSAALSQLASRVSTVFRFGAQAGEDVFGKVKALITDLIAKLESQASADSTEKAFCDEETSKTVAKKDELDATISKLSSKVDSSSAKAMELKGEVKVLNAELAKLEASHAEATEMRQTQHADYVKAKADLELGLTGVRKALSVLSEFFGSAALVQQPAAPTSYSAKVESGSSVVEILEVVESDFAKNLAIQEAEESDAAAQYEKDTQSYKLTKAMKTQDVKYKEKEAKALEKTVSELSADKDSTVTELQAILDYKAKLDERCIAKPEKYEDRKARREAEIAGLKQALNILETETALLQRGKRGFKSSFLGPR